MNHGASRLRLGGLALLAGVLVGCSSISRATPAASPTELPEPTPVVTRFVFDTPLWYAGFVVTLEEALATIDEGGGPVVLRLRLENPGAAALEFTAPIRLTFADHGYDVTRDTVLPDVGPGGSIEAIATFLVGPGEPLDAAVVRIGRSEDHQALVPLGDGVVQPLTLEPQAVAAEGAAQAGDLAVTLRSGILRWDLPDWGEELPRGLVALTLTYDAAFAGTFTGGLALTAESVGLRLPDGRVLAPRRDGRSQSIKLLLPGEPAAGLSSRFEVPADVTGNVALVIRDGGAEAVITFELPG